MQQPCATRYPGGIRFSSPFDPDWTPAMVAEFKRLTPAHLRRYDPDTKEWFIAHAYAPQALTVFLRYWPGAAVRAATDAAGAPPLHPRQPLATARHYTTLHLLPSAPPPVVNAAYRALVKTLHPDLLPAPERDRAHTRMVEVNAAYEALSAHGAT